MTDNIDKKTEIEDKKNEKPNKTKDDIIGYITIFVLCYILYSIVSYVLSSNNGSKSSSNEKIAMSTKNNDNVKGVEVIDINGVSIRKYTKEAREGRECLNAVMRQVKWNAEPAEIYLARELTPSLEKDNNCKMNKYAFYYNNIYVSNGFGSSRKVHFICIENSSNGNFVAVSQDEFNSAYSYSKGNNICEEHEYTADVIFNLYGN